MRETACYETMGQRLMVAPVLTPELSKANPNLLLKPSPGDRKLLIDSRAAKQLNQEILPVQNPLGWERFMLFCSSMFQNSLHQINFGLYHHRLVKPGPFETIVFLMYLKGTYGPARWLTTVIPTCRRQRQEENKFKVSQGYRERLYQKEGIYTLMMKMWNLGSTTFFIIVNLLILLCTFILRLNSKLIAKNYDNVC